MLQYLFFMTRICLADFSYMWAVPVGPFLALLALRLLLRSPFVVFGAMIMAFTIDAQAALELFAAHGYDAVSVEQIAGAVGIKAPSLYNHFVSKRAIFDEIVSDAAARYEDFTAMQSVHVDDADADTGEFLGISEDMLCQKVREIFLYSLHDKTVSRLRKLLTIEQFRSAEPLSFASYRPASCRVTPQNYCCQFNYYSPTAWRVSNAMRIQKKNYSPARGSSSLGPLPR